MKRINYEVTEDTTLDQFLLSFHISKKIVYKLKMDGKVLVNGVKVKTDVPLQARNKVSIETDDVTYKYMNSKKINVVYEDEDILIVLKEAGTIIYGEQNDTLDNRVAYYLRNNPYNFSHVHRLDIDTTGIVVYSKNIFSNSFLSYQIENSIFKKEYIAIVENYFKKKSGTIDLKIGSDRHENNKYRVSSTGKTAITNYEVIEEKNGKSFVRIKLETGRTHQIRVHFSYIGHPIVNDKIYGKGKGNLLLCACKVSFIHPRTRKEVTFEIDKPSYFIM